MLRTQTLIQLKYVMKKVTSGKGKNWATTKKQQTTTRKKQVTSKKYQAKSNEQNTASNERRIK